MDTKGNFIPISEFFEKSEKIQILDKNYDGLTPTQKAQKKYREKNREYYNEYQKNLYQKKKNDEAFMEKHRERCREYAKTHREKIKDALKFHGYEIKPRGRPRGGAAVPPLPPHASSND